MEVQLTLLEAEPSGGIFLMHTTIRSCHGSSVGNTETPDRGHRPRRVGHSKSNRSLFDQFRKLPLQFRNYYRI